MSKLWIGLLAVVSAFGETVPLHFTKDETAAKELVAIVRATADMRDVGWDAQTRSVVLQGDERQTALAKWLIGQLDRAPDAAKTTVEYRVGPGVDDVVKILYAKRLNRTPVLQGMGTVVRAIGDVRRLYVANAAGAVVLRGSAVQARLAEELMGEMERAPGADVRVFPTTFPDPIRHEDTVLVFHLGKTRSLGGAQELAAAIRAAGKVRRVFTCMETWTVVVSGTAEQAALAEWLVPILDGGAMGSREYRTADEAAPLVRLYRLGEAAPEGLVGTLREKSRLGCVYRMREKRILVARGDATVLKDAEAILNPYLAGPKNGGK